MNYRPLYLLAPAVLVASLAVAFGVADSGTADATAVQYTVTVTEGPYNGQAKPGQPGYADPDREAPTVRCHNNNDALLSGAATINLKTSHGTAKAATVDLDRIGAYYDPESDVTIGWGTFIRENGKVGWSSVTITATCLVRTAAHSTDTAPIVAVPPTSPAPPTTTRSPVPTAAPKTIAP